MSTRCISKKFNFFIGIGTLTSSTFGLCPGCILNFSGGSEENRSQGWNPCLGPPPRCQRPWGQTDRSQEQRRQASSKEERWSLSGRGECCYELYSHRWSSGPPWLPHPASVACHGTSPNAAWPIWIGRSLAASATHKYTSRDKGTKKCRICLTSRRERT